MVPVVGVVCPGNCCGGVLVVGVPVVEEDSEVSVGNVMDVVVSSGLTVDEVVVRTGSIVVPVGSVVCVGVVGNCCGGGIVVGFDVVISELLVVVVLVVVSGGVGDDDVVGEVCSGFSVLKVVCVVVGSGVVVVMVVSSVVSSGFTVVTVVDSGFNVVAVGEVVFVDCEPPVFVVAVETV